MSLAKIYSAVVACASAATLVVATRTPAQDAPAAAAPPAAPAHARTETPRVEEEIVVRGRRMSEVELDLPKYIRSFIRQVAAPPAGQGYARWHGRVCVGVYNLQNDAAHYIADHVSGVAAQLGLEPGEPGCTPDDIIIFTVDAESLAAAMVKHRQRMFRPGMGLGGMDRGAAALQDFVRSDRAVRWWHVSMPVDARTGVRAVPLPQDGVENHSVISVAGPSRIHSGIRDDLDHVIVIVDATKLIGTTWQQLADYLAMVSLAQIDPKADLKDFDTILNLFSNSAAYSGLTDWDRSYLRALYSFDQERAPKAQAGEIVTQMVKWESTFGQ